MYAAVFAVLRRLDPEFSHHLGMMMIKALGMQPLRGMLSRYSAPAPSQVVHALGLRFPSPLGLAAGFDKNAEAILGMAALGFGHVEVGTVTARAQPGNPQPRLFRLVDDRALINRMGFNNDGAAVVAERLASLRARHPSLPIIGVNIGKSRVTAMEDAVADYVESATLLAPHADYLAVNVSSPNTPGLRNLQGLASLRPLLQEVLAVAGATPVLVKIAPDLSDQEIADVCDLVLELKLAGLIATNTTVSRSGLVTPTEDVLKIGDGGLSGEPLATRSEEVLGLVRQRLPREICVISVGGVFTGQDVAARLEAGATLVQAYTGFVYRGPLFAKHVLDELESISSD